MQLRVRNRVQDFHEQILDCGTFQCREQCEVCIEKDRYLICRAGFVDGSTVRSWVLLPERQVRHGFVG